VDWLGNVDKMHRTDKIIIIFYVFLAVSFTGGIIYLDEKSFANVKFVNEGKQSINEIAFIETTSVDKKKIFDTMADVQNYPVVLPNNFLSVQIINKTDNVIFAEEEVMEQYLKTKLLVRHTLVPYDKQILEVMDGDAKGTIITETFEQTNSTTKLTTDVKLHVTGKLAPIIYFPAISVQQELDKKIIIFVNYAKGFNSKYEKIVDNIYREVLYRSADPEGLRYYSTMLQSGKMTEGDIRQALSNSDEAKYLLAPSERKSPDELDPNTKKIVNDIYTQILDRPADPQGLTYYGSLLEASKMTQDDVRKALYNSDEAKHVLAPSQRKTPEELKPQTIEILDRLYNQTLGRLPDPQGLTYYGSLLEASKMTQDDVRKALYNSDEAAAMRIHTKTERELDILYEEIFHRHVDQQTIDHYEPLLDSKNMTLDQVRNELLVKK